MANLNRKNRLKWLHVQLGEVVGHLTHIQYLHIHQQHCWRPALNAYRFHDRIEICIDLAGTAKPDIVLEVEPTRLFIQGKREAPEPGSPEEIPDQIICMEIDHGCFEREIPLWPPVDPERVSAEQRDGFLWIHLPLQACA